MKGEDLSKKTCQASFQKQSKELIEDVQLTILLNFVVIGGEHIFNLLQI